MAYGVCVCVKMTDVSDRPNIRIEIQNTLTEPMDVDAVDGKLIGSDFEDGEINEVPENEVASGNKLPQKSTNRAWNNTDGGFTTGINIFDKDEQKKLHERASRFGLKLAEINNFTDEHLQQLHASLGITADNEKNVRFEAIHMRGTDEMSTEDVFEYFGKYGPAYVEWINDESCNVVWNDTVSAARALHFVSKEIKGMPVEGPCDPFLREIAIENETEKEDKNDGRSILLINREIQLQEEESGEKKIEAYNSPVDISEIDTPIPPGYWRLGIEHPKTKFVLLRFTFKTDRKPLRAERFSEYYKKYGNPNFGGLKGLISESRRKKFKGIFDRNKEMVKNNNENGKNPWGDLAESWYEDEQYCEKPYVMQNKQEPPNSTDSLTEKSDVLKRLGVKRDFEDDEPIEEEDDSNKKKSKIPRMRMYADEEEEKMKRKKQLMATKLHASGNATSSNTVQDLRNIIGATTKKIVRHLQQTSLPSNDLGSKLKNRLRSGENVGQVVDAYFEKLPQQSSKEKSLVVEKRSTIREHKLPHRKDDHSRSRYKNKLHSDKREHRKLSLALEGIGTQKPKSKVAVVIKRQQRPTVASTVWSRINIKKERLKTASERLQYRKKFSSSSSSESDSSTSSSSSSEDSSSESSDSENKSKHEAEKEPPKQTSTKVLNRPGFTSGVQSETASNSKAKSPLRIEINNDHFKEE